jgi:prophage maintenance system killer protein
MIKFSKEKVLLLHKLLAEATGGSIGVRDEGLLDSTLESAFSGFGDREFYPTKEEKGARLGYCLILECNKTIYNGFIRRTLKAFDAPHEMRRHSYVQ